MMLRTRFLLLLPLLAVVGFGSARLTAAPERIMGKVATIEDGIVSIDRGSQHGVRRRMIFDIYRPARIVRLPMSNQTVYQKEEVVAQIMAVDVQRSFSRCRILESSSRPEAIRPSDLVVSNPNAVPENAAPIIRNVSLSSDSVAWGETTTLQADIANEDEERVYYEWTATGGILSAHRTGSPSVNWTAPAASGLFVIRMTAIDQGGKTATQPIVVRSTGVPDNPKKVLDLRGYHGDYQKAFTEASDLDVDDSDALYILDRYEERIVRIDPGFRMFQRSIQYERDFGRLATNGTGDIYLLDTYECTVLQYSWGPKMFGEPPVQQYGTYGEGNGMFSTPVDLAVDNRGEVYILDGERANVQAFDKDGNFLISFGRKKQEDEKDRPGVLQRPVALSVDADRTVYVLDDGRKKVVVFEEYRFAREFELPSKADTYSDLALDPFTGNLFVLESSTGRIAGLDPMGKPVGNPTPKGLVEFGTRLAVDNKKTALALGREGTALYRLDGYEDRPGLLGTWMPTSLEGTTDMAVSETGDCALLDTDYGTLQVLDPTGFIRKRLERLGARDVAFVGSERLAILTADAVEIVLIGTGETEDELGDFGGAVDLAAHPTGGELAVLTSGGEVHLVDPKTKRSRLLARVEKLEEPRQVLQTRTGWVLCCDAAGRGAVIRPDGQVFPWNLGYDCRDAAGSTSGLLYFIDGSRIVVRNRNNEPYIDQLDLKGKVTTPTALGLDAAGNLHVFDAETSRIAIFTR